jgi:hypothetical protein
MNRNDTLIEQLGIYMSHFSRAIAYSQKRRDKISDTDISRFETDSTVAGCLTSLSDKLKNSKYKWNGGFWDKIIKVSSEVRPDGTEMTAHFTSLKTLVLDNDMMFTKLAINAMLDGEISVGFYINDAGQIIVDFRNYKIKAVDPKSKLLNNLEPQILQRFDYQAPTYSLTGDNSLRVVICEILHKKQLLEDVMTFGAPMTAMPLLHIKIPSAEERTDPSDPNSPLLMAALEEKFKNDPQANTLMTDLNTQVDSIARSLDYQGILSWKKEYDDQIKETLLSQSSSTKVGAKGSYGAAESIMTNVYNTRVASLAMLKEDLILRFVLQVMAYAGEMTDINVFGVDPADRPLTIVPELRTEDFISMLQVLATSGYVLDAVVLERCIPFIQAGEIRREGV